MTFHHGSQQSYSGPPKASAKQLKPFNTQDVKVLLLENVNLTGQAILKKQGYQVEALKSSLPEDQLIEKIQDVHVIGIRSKTQLSANVLKHAKNLIVIGCFCIGTNQVDLKFAAEMGIAVFNSPFSNSRSVAELMIGEIISLARQLGDRSNEMHKGIWNKVSNGCWEVRGKTLGIIGYGHVGAQLSVLAEAMGMRVIYFDVINMMGLGTANQVPTLEALLSSADFVTLHVPEIEETKNMIGEKELEKMRNGAYLLNASRGSVVDIPALIKYMQNGKLAGAALDVYPNEPGSNGENFNSQLNAWGDELRSLKNLILTPHIGGSTEEAQSAIGVEVAEVSLAHTEVPNSRVDILIGSRELRQLRNNNRRCQHARSQPAFSHPGRAQSRPYHLHPQERARCTASRERNPRRPQRRQANDRRARRRRLPDGRRVERQRLGD